MDAAYLPRLIDPTVRSLFGQPPALMLVGPRAAGKTTSARQLVSTVVRLDRAAEAAAFVADPDAALRALPEPILLDEWQSVPSVLGAVKRAADEEPHPGRFLLTGGVHADLETETWPGTGRVVRLPMYGLTQREVVGRAEGISFVDRLTRDDLAEFGELDLAPDLPPTSTLH